MIIPGIECCSCLIVKAPVVVWNDVKIQDHISYGKKAKFRTDSFNISLQSATTTETNNYKFMWIEIDSSLNLNFHLERSFK